MERFSSNYAFSEALNERITTYLRHRWDNIVRGDKELVDAAQLLDQLPRTLRYEDLAAAPAACAAGAQPSGSSNTPKFSIWRGALQDPPL